MIPFTAWKHGHFIVEYVGRSTKLPQYTHHARTAYSTPSCGLYDLPGRRVSSTEFHFGSSLVSLASADAELPSRVSWRVRLMDQRGQDTRFITLRIALKSRLSMISSTR